MKKYMKRIAAVAVAVLLSVPMGTSIVYAATDPATSASAEVSVEPSPTPEQTSLEESEGDKGQTNDSSKPEVTDSNATDDSSDAQEPVAEPEPEPLPDATVQEPSTPTQDAEQPEDTDVAKTPVADPPPTEAAPAPSTAPAPSAPPAVEAPSAPIQSVQQPEITSIPDGTALARVENGEIWTGDGYFGTSFDYILTDGVESTEVLVKVWKGTFDYTNEVTSDSTGVFTQSGSYSHTFFLPAGDYTFAALIYHQGEDAPRFDRAYPVTVTESKPIDVPAPIQDGNTVIVKPAPEGSEYYNVDTGETVPGNVDLTETGPIKLDARPTGDRPVKTDGPWSYAPVDIAVTPIFPKQEEGNNKVPFQPQKGVIFKDADGNVIDGSFTVTPDNNKVTAVPEKGYYIPKDAPKEKTYTYYKPAPVQTEVTPIFPKQQEGSNVITFTPQPGVIFTDADGNVIDGSFTVTKGKETVYAAPDLDKGYVFSKEAQPEKKYKYYDNTTPAQPIDVPAPIQDGNTVIVKPAPEGSEYYNVDTGETVPGNVDLTETGPIKLDARPTGDRPVKTDGPWSYAPVQPEPQPTPTPSETATPSAPADPQGPGSQHSNLNTGSENKADTLAVTGSDRDLGGVTALALLLIAIGGVTVVGIRRRLHV